MANLLLKQFGGPQGELAATTRYFTQAVAEEDADHKDILCDIATEKLSHLEIIGTIVAMLDRGAKGELAEAVDEQAESYRKLSGTGNDSHVTQVLYGGDPILTNSGGAPWTAAYVGSISEPTTDLCSNIAAGTRARIIYERLINVSSGPGVRDALDFLMTRRIAHRKSFEKALYTVNANFPPDRLPPAPEFNDAYFKMSRSGPIVQAPQNSGTGLKLVADPPVPVDGGDGNTSVSLTDAELAVLEATKTRLVSDPAVDPTTGTEFGEAKV